MLQEAFAAEWLISSASNRDIPALVALELEIQPFPWTERHFADSLQDGHRVRVARMHGQIVAFSVVMQVLDEVHLLNIGVRRAFQGQGYGARMLREAMHHAATHGGARMLLEVRVSNAPALRLYRLLGFRDVAVRKAYYPAVSGREDALVMDVALEALQEQACA